MRPLNSRLDFRDDGASFRVRRLAYLSRHFRHDGAAAPDRWRDLPLYAKLAALAVWSLMGAILIPVAIVGGSMLLHAL